MKTIKRILQLMGLLFIGLCLYVFIGFTYMFYQEHKSSAIGMKNIEGAKVKAEVLTKIHETATIIRIGDKYEKEGKYDLAIEQYKKALEMGANESVCRVSLANVYSKSGQYELALEEINWLIPRIGREEKKKDFIIRKQLLEKLIESQKRVNVTDLDHTAFWVH